MARTEDDGWRENCRIAFATTQSRQLAGAADAAARSANDFTTISEERLTMSTTPNRRIGPLAGIRIFVDDLDEARSFFRDALGFPEMVVDTDWLVYDAGGADLVVERRAPTDADSEPLHQRFTGISWHVDDIDATVDELEAANVTIVNPPERMPWGGVLAHIADPSGNVYTLAQYPNSR